MVVPPVNDLRPGATFSSLIPSVVSPRLIQECGGGRISRTGRGIEGNMNKTLLMLAGLDLPHQSKMEKGGDRLNEYTSAAKCGTCFVETALLA